MHRNCSSWGRSRSGNTERERLKIAQSPHARLAPLCIVACAGPAIAHPGIKQLCAEKRKEDWSPARLWTVHVPNPDRSASMSERCLSSGMQRELDIRAMRQWTRCTHLCPKHGPATLLLCASPQQCLCTDRCLECRGGESNSPPPVHHSRSPAPPPLHRHHRCNTDLLRLRCRGRGRRHLRPHRGAQPPARRAPCRGAGGARRAGRALPARACHVCRRHPGALCAARGRQRHGGCCALLSWGCQPAVRGKEG